MLILHSGKIFSLKSFQQTKLGINEKARRMLLEPGKKCLAWKTGAEGRLNTGLRDYRSRYEIERQRETMGGGGWGS
jgi:hypothetical protein